MNTGRKNLQTQDPTSKYWIIVSSTLTRETGVSIYTNSNIKG